jgi:hypothetical protein
METLPGGDTRAYIKHLAQVRSRLQNPPVRKRDNEPTPEPDPCSCVEEEKIAAPIPVIVEITETSPQRTEIQISRAPRAQFIKEHVSHFYRVTLFDMESGRRDQPIVWARFVAMFLIRHMTRQSWSEIGRRFGGKDHTSVLHAVRRITAELESNEELVEHINELRQRIIAGHPAQVVRFTDMRGATPLASQFWNQEREGILELHWERGVRASAIAKLMGSTKSAVIAKANRMKLSRRTPERRDEWA